MMRKIAFAFAIVAMAVAVLATSSVAGPTSGKRIEGLPNTCKTYGNGKYIIASDLPLQGSLRPLSVQIVQAVRLMLKQVNYKIGDKTITYVSCDDSTAAKGAWDSETCTKNANGYSRARTSSASSARSTRAVPRSSSRSSTALRVARSRWSAPPTRRSASPRRPWCRASRTSTTRPVSATTRASRCPTTSRARPTRTFLKQKGIKSVYVLNDGETYGAGIANNFVNAAKAVGINVLGNDKWDANQPDYQSLFQSIATKNPDGDLPRRPDLTARWPADQGQGRGARGQQARSSCSALTASTTPRP